MYVGKNGELIVRTSDRGLFRRCRRRWVWNSPLQGNWEPRQHSLPLWLGSGFHFALEDFHGYRRWENASSAFLAYAKATQELARKTHTEWDWDTDEESELAVGMLNYYQHHWLKNRPALETYVFNDELQVEVEFEILLPIKGPHGEPVKYRGTIDRVAVDSTGALYIVEYKTAARFSTTHFDTDPQCTAYCWAGSTIYDRPVLGVIYQQHLKALPQPPRFLKSRGKISTDRRQHTTATLYREALLNLYEKVDSAPRENIEFYNELIHQEDEYQDRFIRRDFVTRNEYQIEAESDKILAEVEEMINPNIKLYPSPTRDCAHFCPFVTACVSLDDGSDFEAELDEVARRREANELSWRKLVPEIREVATDGTTS